ncbi:MAG TPA: flagellar biosynthesis protein FlhB [Terrisporobacter glycolicus]|uniref:fused FliR family export protein/FlhB family type III secretion system protein n=1 Tax=Terrisporobacter TaxID=1505652 RepID=UPI000E7F34FA|nr:MULTISPECIES: fused FliR family export protein/FlhB family type III secretion system protein [Terrisporobacter]MBN9647278.1 fused FliR family export protein/FlhB family type III secretion system protein [Terrisporobacter glycolicus]HBI92869.1 flagellar biosynthesis protein FlhB [Terrisporobacter hibernicus]
MLFIFIRVITFFSSLNILFPSGTPNTFKVCFSILMSIIISSGVNIDVNVLNTFDLIRLVAMETVNGLLLGYITNLCFNSLKIAGSLIDQQIGLSMSSIYDPNSKEQATLIENLMYWMGIIIFFSMNGHHKLIIGIQQSFHLIKIGENLIQNNFYYIIHVFVQCFTIGFKIAVPVILSLIFTDLIMGLISRSVPQLNVMIIGMPLKMLVGVVFFMIALPFVITEIHNLLNKIPDILDGTLSMVNGDMMTSLGPVGIVLSMGGDKTEEPTAKKKRDARKKGNIAKSKEVTTAITLVAMLIIIFTMSDYIILEIKNSMINLLSSNFSLNFDSGVMLNSLGSKILLSFMKIFLPIGFIIMIFGVIGNLIQSGMLFTGEGLKPQFSKLNPINGFKNMFSLKALGTLVKSVAIIGVLLYIGYSFMNKNFEGIMKSADIYLPYLLNTIIELIKSLLGRICLAVVLIAVVDYGYQRFTHNKELKMTKQEVKEEYKQMEGDPQVKGKIKQKQREISNRRMMQAVPSATVIVTNPTHISIAIKYEKGIDSTPRVVAKGADVVAFKIREVAKEHDIPIIENKPLARLIYKEVDIDKEIPEEMYQAVAEVLVAVYKIKNKYK